MIRKLWRFIAQKNTIEMTLFSREMTARGRFARVAGSNDKSLRLFEMMEAHWESYDQKCPEQYLLAERSVIRAYAESITPGFSE